MLLSIVRATAANRGMQSDLQQVISGWLDELGKDQARHAEPYLCNNTVSHSPHIANQAEQPTAAAALTHCSSRPQLPLAVDNAGTACQVLSGVWRGVLTSRLGALMQSASSNSTSTTT